MNSDLSVLPVYDIGYLNLNFTAVLMKPYQVNAHESVKSRLFRVMCGGSPTDERLYLMPFSTIEYDVVNIILCTRDAIEGWVKDDEVEKFLIWKALINEN